jgi:hypothetical protein
MLGMSDYHGSRTNLDNDTQNTVLIKAIQLFASSKCNLKLEAANLDLASAKMSRNNDYDDYDSDDEK